MENMNQPIVESSIRVDEMKIIEADMQKELSSLRFTESKCCIYKVPECIRKGKEDCYQPSVISIGPVFNKKPELEPMQELKWIYLDAFLQHPDNAFRNLDHYINLISEMKDDIRDCYQEKKMMINDVEFVKLILVDAIFILAIFLHCPPSRPVPKELDILCLLAQRDLLLEENQIPFFVLNGIYDSAFPTEKTSFIDVTRSFMSRLSSIPGAQYVGISEMVRDASKIVHLLDFFRKACCFSFQKPEMTSKPAQLPDTVKQLVAAGVKVKLSESLNPLEITFNKSNGELHIPHITVDERTETVLRNFLHFELCHYFMRDHCYFIDLFFFLDSLIDNVEDIQILQEKGILKSYLGSDEKTAKLFNNITTDVGTKTFFNHYSEVSKDVNEYANKPWNKWIAILRRDYFKHPWAIISFIFAIILFVLTVLQTITGFTNK